jgi:hypothetical protein
MPTITYKGPRTRLTQRMFEMLDFATERQLHVAHLCLTSRASANSAHQRFASLGMIMMGRQSPDGKRAWSMSRSGSCTKCGKRECEVKAHPMVAPQGRGPSPGEKVDSLYSIGGTNSHDRLLGRRLRWKPEIRIMEVKWSNCTA